MSGRSSGVEHNLAKVRVVSSNLIARSNFSNKMNVLNSAFGRWELYFCLGQHRGSKA